MRVDDVADLDHFVVPGVLRNDDLRRNVVRYEVRDIAAGDRRNDLLHQRGEGDQAVVDRVAARLLVFVDDPLERGIFLGHETLGPPDGRGLGRSIGDKGASERAGRRYRDRAAKNRAPGEHRHMAFPSLIVGESCLPHRRNIDRCAACPGALPAGNIRLIENGSIVIAMLHCTCIKAGHQRRKPRGKPRKIDVSPTRQIRNFTPASIGRRRRDPSAPATTAHVVSIGYLAKICSTHLNALSAAACGVIPSLMISAQAAPKTCWLRTSAQAGL